jgi:hypothetical protein
MGGRSDHPHNVGDGGLGCRGTGPRVGYIECRVPPPGLGQGGLIQFDEQWRGHPQSIEDIVSTGPWGY